MRQQWSWLPQCGLSWALPGAARQAGRRCRGARAHPAMAAESPPLMNTDTDAPKPLASFQPDRSRHRLGALQHSYALMSQVSLWLGSQSLQVPPRSPALGSTVVFLSLSCQQVQHARRAAWPGAALDGLIVGKELASSPGEPDTRLELGQYLAAPGSSLAAPGQCKGGCRFSPARKLHCP